MTQKAQANSLARFRKRRRAQKASRRMRRLTLEHLESRQMLAVGMGLQFDQGFDPTGIVVRFRDGLDCGQTQCASPGTSEIMAGTTTAPGFDSFPGLQRGDPRSGGGVPRAPAPFSGTPNGDSLEPDD